MIAYGGCTLTMYVLFLGDIQGNLKDTIDESMHDNM
jgi:hypothetical protein